MDILVRALRYLEWRSQPQVEIQRFLHKKYYLIVYDKTFITNNYKDSEMI